jgi:Novel STAND NTPase 1
MVLLTEDERWVKRIGAWKDILESIHPVVERLVTARLLISGGDSEGRMVGVRHEGLFRSWGRLVTWFDPNIEFLRLTHEPPPGRAELGSWRPRCWGLQATHMAWERRRVDASSDLPLEDCTGSSSTPRGR